MQEDGERHWRGLRMLRASPPGWADKGARRTTFAAALAQSEDLWRAGAALTPATSPIVLYYALAQGGKALIAAHLKSSAWEGPPSHGLALGLRDVTFGATPALADYEVRPSGRGLVDAVAGVLASPVLTGPEDLESLACSLPDQEDFALDNPGRSRPLRVYLLAAPTSGPQIEAELSVGPLPGALLRSQPRENYAEMIAPSPAEARDWLHAYPRLAALGEPTRSVHVSPILSADRPAFSVRLAWALPEPMDIFATYRWAGRKAFDIADPGPVGGLPSSGTVLPAVASNPTAQHPLVAWWVLLYSLSMLARYHPRAWTALLDVDRSPQAVPLGIMLTAGANAIPRLLLHAMLADDEDTQDAG
jgi:hypothetical protein